MKNFAEKIKSLLTLKSESTSPADYPPFGFVKNKKGILKELIIARQSGKLVGVYSRVFGEGMFLTGVENIETHGRGELIIFNRYDMSGQPLARTRLSLDEIHMVCPFNKAFERPAINHVDFNKSPW